MSFRLIVTHNSNAVFWAKIIQKYQFFYPLTILVVVVVLPGVSVARTYFDDSIILLGEGHLALALRLAFGRG